jgi:cystathionine beta-lyase/cystathionine gamma-synthase
MPESYQLNVPVNLIRLAVGLEYVGDLIEDLDQALIRSTAVQKI